MGEQEEQGYKLNLDYLCTIGIDPTKVLFFRKTQPMGDEAIVKIYQKLEANPYPNAEPLDTETLTLEQCVEKINSDINR